jgi:hypothetical protein
MGFRYEPEIPFQGDLTTKRKISVWFDCPLNKSRNRNDYSLGLLTKIRQVTNTVIATKLQNTKASCQFSKKPM